MINFNSTFSNYLSPYKESFLPTLNSQHKKILKVIALSLAFLVACYVVGRYCLKGKPMNVKKGLNNEKEKMNPAMGRIIDGNFTKNGLLLNGVGRVSYIDGTILEGTFKDDKLEGQGIIFFNKGIKEGEFKQGQLCKGKLILRNESIAEGEFIDDKLQGIGKITYNDGRIENGIFEKGILIQPKK